MNLTDTIRRFVWGPLLPGDPPDERTLTPNQAWARGIDWHPVNATGLYITTELAMKAAQGACIRLLADDISGLPVDTFRKVNGRAVEIPRPAWLAHPRGDRWYGWTDYISEVVVSLLSEGVTFVRCWPDTINPEVFTVLDPLTVAITAPGRYRVNGMEDLDDSQIMQISWVTLPGRLRPLSVIEAAEDTSGLELAARAWAGAFFRNGGTLGGIIKMDQQPTEDQLTMLRQQFESRHVGPQNFWRPGILTGGADYDSNVVTPQEAALEPLWRHVLEEAARTYHIPPHMLASQQPGGSSYSSIEHRSIEYVQHAVVNVTTRVERPHSLLIPGDDTFLRLNVNALLRGDMKARAEFYGIMLGNKVMLREEVRDKEDLPYQGDLGWLETPNNNGVRESAPPAEPRSEPVIVEAPAPVTVNVTEGRSEPSSINAAPTFHFESLNVTDETAKRLVEEEGGKVREEFARLEAETAAEREATEARIAEIVQSHAERDAERLRTMAEQDQRTAALEARIAQLSAVRIREAIRDERGVVTDIYERQGDRVTHLVVDSDEDGRFRRMREVAS